MINKTIVKTLFFTSLLVSSAAMAATSVGPYTFADNAFVDQITGYTGSGADDGTGIVNPVSSPDNLTDKAANTFLGTAASWMGPSYATMSIDMAFSDNQVFNGAGADLQLFFLFDQAANNVSMTIGGATQALSISTVNGYVIDGVQWGTTSLDNVLLQVANVDLASFGFAYGDELTSSFSVNMTENAGGTPVALALVGAAYTSAPAPVPVPAAVWLFGSGLLGLVGVARRRS